MHDHHQDNFSYNPSQEQFPSKLVVIKLSAVFATLDNHWDMPKCCTLKGTTDRNRSWAKISVHLKAPLSAQNRAIQVGFGGALNHIVLEGIAAPPYGSAESGVDLCGFVTSTSVSDEL
jgi:hypothetical protein